MFKKLLLNRPLFYASLGVLTAIIIGLLFYAQCRPERTPLDELMDVDDDGVPLTHDRALPKLPAVMFCSGFTLHQMNLIDQAAKAWMNRAGLIIQIEDWDPPEPFTHDAYVSHPKYTMWLLDGNDREVAVLEAKYSMKMGGLAVGNYVGILKDSELDDQQFLRAVAHELGHFLGLEHIHPKWPALMNLKAKDALTKYDLMQVEYVYGVSLL